jgi:hypothetical protein
MTLIPELFKDLSFHIHAQNDYDAATKWDWDKVAEA